MNRLYLLLVYDEAEVQNKGAKLADGFYLINSAQIHSFNKLNDLGVYETDPTKGNKSELQNNFCALLDFYLKLRQKNTDCDNLSKILLSDDLLVFMKYALKSEKENDIIEFYVQIFLKLVDNEEFIKNESKFQINDEEYWIDFFDWFYNNIERSVLYSFFLFRYFILRFKTMGLLGQKKNCKDIFNEIFQEMNKNKPKLPNIWFTPYFISTFPNYMNQIITGFNKFAHIFNNNKSKDFSSQLPPFLLIFPTFPQFKPDTKYLNTMNMSNSGLLTFVKIREKNSPYANCFQINAFEIVIFNKRLCSHDNSAHSFLTQNELQTQSKNDNDLNSQILKNIYMFPFKPELSHQDLFNITSRKAFQNYPAVLLFDTPYSYEYIHSLFPSALNNKPNTYSQFVEKPQFCQILYNFRNFSFLGEIIYLMFSRNADINFVSRLSASNFEHALLELFNRNFTLKSLEEKENQLELIFAKGISIYIYNLYITCKNDFSVDFIIQQCKNQLKGIQFNIQYLINFIRLSLLVSTPKIISDYENDKNPQNDEDESDADKNRNKKIYELVGDKKFCSIYHILYMFIYLNQGNSNDCLGEIENYSPKEIENKIKKIETKKEINGKPRKRNINLETSIQFEAQLIPPYSGINIDFNGEYYYP